MVCTAPILCSIMKFSFIETFCNIVSVFAMTDDIVNRVKDNIEFLTY